MNAPNEIHVIGAGISGITCALLLQAAGYQTRIITTDRADNPGALLPEFASLYPAASIIPHSVAIDQMRWHMQVSLAYFQKLKEMNVPGVRLQPHFEVAEFPQSIPSYASLMPLFEKLPDDGSGHPDAPKRPEADQIFGWRFHTYFADMPRYLPWLFREYESLGGTLVERRFSTEEFSTTQARALINCAGRWAVELVTDDAPYTILRGHLIKIVPRHGFDEHVSFHPKSYNYIPLGDTQVKKSGQQPEVYFYPRRDAWVLGGTRQEGRPGIEAVWEGEEVHEPSIEIGGVRLPRMMLELNKTLIKQVTGVDVSAWEATADVGYRFARDLQGEGVRLEVTREAGVPVIHNYGHGGAGVALSWSCALQVLRLLRNKIDIRASRKTRSGISPELAQLASIQPEKYQSDVSK